MFNFLEKFVFKRIVKKLIKAFPSLKDKGLKVYEENKEEIIQKVKTVILELIKKLANK
jgi:histone H3/H4